MAIIVDGYNVLHTSRWLATPWKGTDRQGLCRLLGQLAKLTGEKITVVFDALPCEPGFGRGYPLELEVIFSGHKRSADEVIIEMVQQSSGPRELTVVSSDREIRTAATRRGCKVTSAGTFVKDSSSQLAQAKRKKNSEPHEKQQGLSREQTDQWLSEFGLDPNEDEDPYEPMRRG